MTACPHCRSASPGDGGVCDRCGADLFALPAVTLPTPLPAPMVEPIDAPPASPSDAAPLPERPALTLRHGGASVLTLRNPVRVSDVTPAPVGDGMPSSPYQNRIAPGVTSPAHPGLPGHPMNDSGVQNPPMTIPATDPADRVPDPVPPPALRPKLVVLRGMKIDAEYPIYEGRNTIGRFADKPVDIDLMAQESVEQIWCSRQHAAVILEKDVVSVEDLNSLNGTWVNGQRIHPGQRRLLRPGDVIQIGTVQMKLVFV